MAAGMSETGNHGLNARKHWRTPRLIRFAVTIFLICVIEFCSVEMLSAQFASKPVFPKSRQHVCFVRHRIQMSYVGFVKIINIWCLSVQFGRRSMKSIREDCETSKRNADELWKPTHQSFWFAGLRNSVSIFSRSKSKIAAVIMKWLSQGIPFICGNVGTYKHFWIPRSSHE